MITVQYVNSNKLLLSNILIIRLKIVWYKLYLNKKFVDINLKFQGLVTKR